MDRLYRAARTLMIQGTSSGAGKSTLVAALCRILARRGLRVAPFKPQNMSLNSAVTADGGEIGRAQALQAIAARVPALADMNPVLLKPSSDTRAQLVVSGKPYAQLGAEEFFSMKERLLPGVMDAFERLRGAFDGVVVEGAGSPAEVNLRAHDIANMGFAEAADCPVALVADIDRGGVFAHIVGTLECLSETERARIAGFIINRFRGERALLTPGIRWLEARTGKPVFGVLDYLQGLALDEEDALPRNTRAAAGAFRIAVPVYPRISNHTDLDPLRWEDSVHVRFIGPGHAFPEGEDAPDLIVLPGSKNVRADLEHLRRAGWERSILRHARRGAKIVGLCGGMQMLGLWIHDPLGVEGEPGSTRGLGLLELETTLEAQKQLRNCRGVVFPGTPHEAPFTGYEIHMGVTRGPALERPAALIEGLPDGAISDDGRILATYAHGIFDGGEPRRALMAWAGCERQSGPDLDERREQSLERLADHVEKALDLRRLLSAFAQP